MENIKKGKIDNKFFAITNGTTQESLYYGDELGMLRSLWIEANENKNKSNEEKRFYESLNISYETYKLAKQYHSPENANSLMSWDNSNNSGFSNVSKYNSSPVLNYKNNNVESEFLLPDKKTYKYEDAPVYQKKPDYISSKLIKLGTRFAENKLTKEEKEKYITTTCTYKISGK